MTALEKALRHFAEAYHAGVVGSEWDEACDLAETVANRFRWQASETREGKPHSDRVVADYLYAESARYEDM